MTDASLRTPDESSGGGTGIRTLAPGLEDHRGAEKLRDFRAKGIRSTEPDPSELIPNRERSGAEQNPVAARRAELYGLLVRAARHLCMNCAVRGEPKLLSDNPGSYVHRTPGSASLYTPCAAADYWQWIEASMIPVLGVREEAS